MTSLADLEAVARGAAPPPLDDDDRARIAAARQVVEDALRSGRTVYGVTTGFGDLVTVSIAPEDAAQLQGNLLRSTVAGAGGGGCARRWSPSCWRCSPTASRRWCRAADRWGHPATSRRSPISR